MPSVAELRIADALGTITLGPREKRNRTSVLPTGTTLYFIGIIPMRKC